MAKKKEQLSKRFAGLVINPPKPRPVDSDHPNNFLFPQSQENLMSVDPLDLHVDQVDHQNQQTTLNQLTTQSIVNPVQSELGLVNSVHDEPSLQKTQLLTEPTKKIIPPLINLTETNGYKIPNFLDDEILPDLTPPEQILLRRLYRLSYGFNRQTTDSVGIHKLAIKCNLSESTIKRTLKSLSDRKLIVIHLDESNNPKGGNKYSVLTKLIMNPVHNEPSSTKTQSIPNHIKDHDDLKRQDHHQTEHQKNVMTIYQTITQNSWTKADLATYQKIKNIPLESIEIAIKLATQRASSRPNSLAFFVKEIIATANPKTNRSKQKKSMEKIVDRLRNSLVGSTYSMSDFVYKVKESCLRENIAFDNDLLDEILTR
jgi:hypothetical protein